MTTVRLISLLLLGLCLGTAQGVSWRVFVGRDDCVSEWLPENQADMLRQSFEKRNANMPSNMNIVIEAGFLVANKYGAETTGTVDVWVRNPDNNLIYTKEGVSEDSFNIHAKGSSGPWQLCFRVSNTETPHQHALTVELSYFTVNLRALVGTDHEQTKGPKTVELNLGGDVNITNLASGEDLTSVKNSLTQLNIHLNQVKRQQRYLQMRTDRHMKTIKSTHGRALWWSFFEAAVIIVSSFVQVFAVRHLFSSNSKTFRV